MYCVQYLTGKWFVFKKTFPFLSTIVYVTILQVSQGAERPKDLNLLREFFHQEKDMIRFTTEHSIS